MVQRWSARQKKAARGDALHRKVGLQAFAHRADHDLGHVPW